MNFIHFGNQTINLDNVTHIERGDYERHDGRVIPYICFHFVGGYAGDSEDCVKFLEETWDGELVLAYLEASQWLETGLKTIN